jgi:hypothetical protein
MTDEAVHFASPMIRFRAQRNTPERLAWARTIRELRRGDPIQARSVWKALRMTAEDVADEMIGSPLECGNSASAPFW